MVADRLAPLLGKAPSELIPRCALGSADRVRERIQAFADAGAQQIHLWPAADPLVQIEALAEVAIPASARVSAPANPGHGISRIGVRLSSHTDEDSTPIDRRGSTSPP